MPRDRQELGEVLKEYFAIPRADAMQLAAAAPGLLRPRAPEAEAHRLADHLCEKGLHAEVVCSSEIPRLEAAEDSHHVRCSSRGLEIVELHSATERVIPWDAVEMIAIGQPPVGFTRHYADDPTIPTAGRRAPRPSFVASVTSGPELWLVARDPVRSLRIHHEAMNYEYLGPRRSTASTINFRLLIEDLVGFAPQAFQTTATQAWLANGPGQLFAFETAVEFERWSVLQLLQHRAMLAREASWKESGDHFPAETAPTEGLWHCLYCGSLKRTAGGAAPQCCGQPMLMAAGIPQRSWNEAAL